MLGTILLWKLPRSNEIGLLFAYYLLGAFVGSLVMSLQMPSTNLGGYTKRVTATALVFLGYCIGKCFFRATLTECGIDRPGNIIGPHTFLADEAPIYPTGCKIIISCACIQFALAVFLRCLLIRRNRERDARQQAAHSEDSIQDMILDLTDFEVSIRSNARSRNVCTDRLTRNRILTSGMCCK